jgi:D-threo-aldose 1-dehydrogenase
MITERASFGKTGLRLPPIVFGSSSLGNLYRELPIAEKRALAAAWFREVNPPVVIDSAGKYGAGLALETIRILLSELEVPGKDVIVSNKLGWKRVPLSGKEPTFEPGIWKGLTHDAVLRIGYRGILECWEQGCELLGPEYAPALVSVHDPDEYLAAAGDVRERAHRRDDLLEAYRALGELKASGAVQAVGVGAKDWTVIREIASMVELDWVMFACSLTVYRHPPELLEFLDRLRARGTAVINSAVFHAGFLTGGEYFDYQKTDPVRDAGLYAWRDRFRAVCGAHGITPEAACMEFALSHPAVNAVAVNTAKQERVAENVALLRARAPEAFWVEMKRAGMIDPAYPYLPVQEVRR